MLVSVNELAFELAFDFMFGLVDDWMFGLVIAFKMSWVFGLIFEPLFSRATELLTVIDFEKVPRTERRQAITSKLEHTPPKTIR